LCANFHDLARAADNSSTTHAVILYFKKAFDKVSYLLLMEKSDELKELTQSLLIEYRAFWLTEVKKW